MQKNSVTKTLWEKGKLLNNKIQSIITKLKLDDVIKIKGFDPWKIVMYSDFKNVEKEYIKTFIIKKMLSQGILVNSSHNVMYSLTNSQINKIALAYSNAFKELKNELENNSLKKNLKTKPIYPVFSVRSN